MANNVDKRIVQMQFDNAQFEKGIKTSTESLNKFSQSLDMSGAAKGLDSINAAAKKIDVSPIGNAVETVKAKFSAFEVIAVTALVNITNQAIEAGMQLIKSLSTDNIAMGWEKYERKTAATQTIMNATGKSAEEVGEALEKLMWYSDETSYNFTAMVENIGKFTATGVDLDDAITAMMGIANWAAASGVAISDADRAFEAMSKAMGSGALTLSQWYSLESLVMTTKEFQEVLVETALEIGTLREANTFDGFVTTTTDGNDKVKMFDKSLEGLRDSLSGKWITPEVMMATFAKYGEYADAIYEISDAYDTASEAMAAFGTEGYERSAKWFEAAQVAKTLTDSIDSVKDAVSTKWAQTFELIFGNFEEAKELWTDLANALWEVFAAGGDERNEMLAAWKKLGGREKLINSLWNAFYALQDVINLVKEAFRDIFPPITAEKLLSLTEKVEAFTEKLKMNEETSEKVKKVLKGFFSIFDIGYQTIKAVVPVFSKLLKILTPVSGKLFDFIVSIANYISGLDESIKATGALTTAFSALLSGVETFVSKAKALWADFASKVHDTFAPIVAWIKNFAVAFSEAFLEFVHVDTSGFDNFMDKFKAKMEPFTKIGEMLSKVGEALKKSFAKISPIFLKLGNIFGNLFGSIREAMSNTFTGLNFDTLFKGFSIGSIVAISAAIKGFVDNLSDIVDPKKGIFSGLTDVFKSVNKVFDNVAGILDGVKDVLKAYTLEIKSEVLRNIAVSVGILALSLIGLAMVEPDRLMTALGVLAGLITELMGSMAAFSQISSGGGMMQLILLSSALQKIAISVLILAAALKLLSSIGWDELSVGLIGIGGLAFILVATAKSLQKNNKGFVKAATSLILLSVAIRILASALKVMGSLSLDQMAVALLGTSAALGIMVKTLQSIPNSRNMIKGVSAILALSVALNIMGGAMWIIGSLSWESLAKAMLGIIVALGFMVIALNAMPNSGKILKSAVAITLLSVALNIMGGAMWIIGSLSWESLAKAMLGIIVALGFMVIALNAMPNSGKILSGAAAILIMSVALNAIGGAMHIMGSLSWEQLAKGLLAIVGAMAVMVIALNLMKGTLAGAAALIVASAALMMFVPVLMLLGSMKLEEIGKGLLAIAGVFAVLGIAGLLLKSLIAPIMGLSAAIVLLGVGIAAIGAGVLLFAVAMGMLAVTGTAGAMALSAIVASILSIIPFAIKQLGYGILAFCEVIAQGAPAVGEAIKALILSLVDVIVECTPAIVDGIFVLVDEILKTLVTYTPSIVDSILKLIIDVINSITANLPAIIQAVMNFLGTLFDEIVKAVSDFDISNVIAALGVVAVLSGIIIALSLVESQAKKALVTIGIMAALVAVIAAVFYVLGSMDTNTALGVGTALAEVLLSLSVAMLIISNIPISGALTGIAGLGIVIGGMAVILAALGGLAQIPGLTWLLEEGTAVFVQIGSAIGGFVGAIAGSAIEGIVEKLADSIDYFWQTLNKDGGFIEGVSSLDVSLLAGAGILAGAILALTAAELIQGIASFLGGGISFADLGDELASFAPGLKTFADELNGVNGDQLQGIAGAAVMLGQFMSTLGLEGGLLQSIIGERTNLVDFATELKEFGPEFVAFVHTVEELTPEQIEPAMLAAQLISDFANNLPKHGGVLQDLIGDATLSTFAEELKDFAPALVEYVNTVSEIANENTKAIVQTSIDAAEIIRAFSTTLPPHGGVVQWFQGDATLSTFAAELNNFGPSLVAYVNLVSTLDQRTARTAVATSISAARIISSFAGNLPRHGGIRSWFIGDSTLSTFAAELNNFGPSIVNFAETVDGLNKDDVETAATAGKMLAELGNMLPEKSSVWDEWFGSGSTMSLKEFGDQIKPLGEAMGAFSEKVANVDSKKTNDMILGLTRLAGIAKSLSDDKVQGAMTDFADAIKALGDSGIDKFVEQVEGADEKVSDAIVVMIGYAVAAVEDGLPGLAYQVGLLAKEVADALDSNTIHEKYRAAGREVIEKFYTGLYEKRTDAWNIMTRIVSGLKQMITNSYDDFKESGFQVVSGLVEGMNAYQPVVKKAGAAVGNTALNGLNVALAVKSPSREAAKTGTFFVQGFINAINDNLSIIDDNASAMGGTALDSLKEAIAKVGEYAMNDVDVDPKITPVLDLSQIQNGIAAMNGMIGARSYGIGANISYDRATRAASEISVKSKNNTDLVKEIQLLREDMAIYTKAAEETRIILDGDTLVGAITPKIDKNLGRRAVYAGRRN